MRFSEITCQDLEALKLLQPPDWSDIIPDLQYYIKASFCFPLKVESNGEIAGIGAAIIYGDTAWLAHIIVHPGFRNKGIGYAIVQQLLDIVNKSKVNACLLTATIMGKPVYEKAGFRSISEYVFLNRIEPWKEQALSDCIKPFCSDFRDQIYQLDADVSGENRQLLLNDFIHDTKVYVKYNTVLGYCITSLKEGPIIAMNEEAGIELMKVKYRTYDKAVIPDENVHALKFLLKNGFKPAETKGTRMILGNELRWKPTHVYSRAGGNFG